MFAKQGLSLIPILAILLMCPESRAQHDESDGIGGFSAEGAGTYVVGQLSLLGAEEAERQAISLRPLLVPLTSEPVGSVANWPDTRSLNPKYGFIRLGSAGRIYFALDQSEPGSQFYDLLYIDRNQNRNLGDDGAPIRGVLAFSEERHLDYTEFPAIDFDLYYGPENNEDYAFMMYLWYPRAGALDRAYVTALSARKGQVEVEGEVHDIVLFDENNDGVYDLEDTWWSMIPETVSDRNIFERNSRVPVAVSIRVKGIPYRPSAISPEGRLIELRSQPEIDSKAAEIAFDSKLAEPERSRTTDEILWVSSMEIALEAARNEKRNVFLLFAANWAQSSHDFEKRTLQDSEVVSLLETYICIRLNPDTSPNLAREYSVKACPTALILDTKGHVLSSQVGYRPARATAGWLRQYQKSTRG